MFSDPRVVLDAIGVSAGMVVGDFGTGEGAYARELARLVGDAGVVCAFDIQKPMVERLVAHAREHKLDNLRPMWADLEDPPADGGGTTLSDQSLDLAVIANMLFQVEDKEAFLAEVVRVMRQNGRVAVVDWSDSHGHMGPHPDHVVSQDAMKTLATDAGLQFDKEFPAGEHHYGLIFRKK